MRDSHPIEDLPIAYTAVATDIVNEKEVWFSSGPLFQAIRASISMPVFFTPAKPADLSFSMVECCVPIRL